MKPTLKHKPDSYAYRDLLVSFANGKPLSCDKLNFLARHEKILSSHTLDPILNYYLKTSHQKQSAQFSFLIHQSEIDKKALQELKARLQILLTQPKQKLQKRPHVQFNMTPQQFLEFKKINYQDLILYYGNQFLTGAPFQPGGIPHVIYFQWGNLFGVAKYLVLAEEKSLKSNVLIYIEDMEEREFVQCVDEYSHHLKNELVTEEKLALTHHAQQLQHEPMNYMMFHIPTLSLAPKHLQENEK